MPDSYSVAPVDSSGNGAGVSEQIYRNVRRAIILGDLPSGSRINEQRFAEALGVSRVPLREAMPRLEADGFISTAPHRSAIVTGWSTARVLDVFSVRLAIEPAAMQRATIAVRTGASTAPAEEALENAARMSTELSVLELADLHADLYVRFANLVGNELMTSMVQTVSHRMAWLFYRCPPHPPKKIHDELREVLQAVQAQDGELAAAAMYRHIAKSSAGAVAAIEDGTAIPTSWTGM